MTILFVSIIVYITISIVTSIIFTSDGPYLQDYILLEVIKWKEVNIFGKICLLILMLPMIIFEYIAYGITFLCTWHPSKKN